MSEDWLKLPTDDLPDAGALAPREGDSRSRLQGKNEEDYKNTAGIPDDPTAGFYTRALALDIAMRTATIPEILDAHKLTYEQLADIMADPGFAAMLKEVHEQTQKEGVSFKLKAQLMAESLLGDIWEMTHNKAVPAAVRADLAKSVVKWAGYEPKETKAQSQGGQTFMIQMNLSGSQPPVVRTIENED